MIRVATVYNVIGRVLLLLFDGHNKFQYMDFESEDVYHTGWCMKTGHPLSTPHGIGKSTLLRNQFKSGFRANVCYLVEV